LDGYWFETAMRMAQHARVQDIIITLDPSSRLLHNPQAPELFRYVDYFMPGYALAHRFTGEADPFHAATALLRHGFRAVIITKGEAGCFVATPEEHYHLPAFEVPVIDTTGAGDTFHGAFVAGLSKGYHLRQALQFASAVAALKCTKLGGQAGIPTFQETQRFLTQHGLAGS
jgi:sugar/nucleoside kinase (ribokinase family)